MTPIEYAGLFKSPHGTMAIAGGLCTLLKQLVANLALLPHIKSLPITSNFLIWRAPVVERMVKLDRATGATQ
jgi:hypothetical protein